LFTLMIPPPPPSTPFPYTTLFRSGLPEAAGRQPRPAQDQSSHPQGVMPPARAPPLRSLSRPRRSRGPRIRARAAPRLWPPPRLRSEEHTSELQSRFDLVCRLLLEK